MDSATGSHGSVAAKLLAGVFTLTLCAMGSAVLPLPWAFSVTSIGSGTCMLLLVAAANVYTCDILLHAAHITGTRDYESLAFAIGGKPFKVVTETFVVLLLYGSIIGTLVQLAEISSFTIRSYWLDAPAWLLARQGAFIMLLLVLLLVLPLSMLPNMESLEYAGMLGCSLVAVLVTVVVADSVRAGLPALRSGDFPLTGIKDLGAACGASSVFGFAFYLQPFIMPLLSEMPPGRLGVQITSWSMRITLLGSCMATYLLVGFFGAARYGGDSRGDLLQNEWLKGLPGFLLNMGVTAVSCAVYLALSTPCIEVAMRHTIQGWLPLAQGHSSQPQSTVPSQPSCHEGTDGRFKEPAHHHKLRRDHFLIAVSVLGSSGAIATFFPANSAAILVITGAVGVCAVSYVIPITIHLALYCGVAKCQLEAAARRLPSSRSFRAHGCWNASNPVGKPLGRILRRLSSIANDEQQEDEAAQPLLRGAGSLPRSIDDGHAGSSMRWVPPVGGTGGSLRGALSLLLHTLSWTATPPGIAAPGRQELGADEEWSTGCGPPWSPATAAAASPSSMAGGNSNGKWEAVAPKDDDILSPFKGSQGSSTRWVTERMLPSALTASNNDGCLPASAAVRQQPVWIRSQGQLGASPQTRILEPFEGSPAAAFEPFVMDGIEEAPQGAAERTSCGDVDANVVQPEAGASALVTQHGSNSHGMLPPAAPIYAETAMHPSIVSTVPQVQHNGLQMSEVASSTGVTVRGRWALEDETYCLLEDPYCARSSLIVTLLLDLILPLAVAGIGCFASVAALADLANNGSNHMLWWLQH